MVKKEKTSKGSQHATRSRRHKADVDNQESRNRKTYPDHLSTHPTGWFVKIASAVAYASGTPYAFLVCITIVAIWLVTGPAFHYSDTWQLIINTGTTIITFLMVFLIQNTQNRDATALHLKIDELIIALKTANNEMIDIENLSDQDLAALHARFTALKQRAELSDQENHTESEE